MHNATNRYAQSASGRQSIITSHARRHWQNIGTALDAVRRRMRHACTVLVLGIARVAERVTRAIVARCGWPCASVAECHIPTVIPADTSFTITYTPADAMRGVLTPRIPASVPTIMPVVERGIHAPTMGHGAMREQTTIRQTSPRALYHGRGRQRTGVRPNECSRITSSPCVRGLAHLAFAD